MGQWGVHFRIVGCGKKMVQGLTGKDESTVEALSGTVHQNGEK
jgi:hypothetical protein